MRITFGYLNLLICALFCLILNVFTTITAQTNPDLLQVNLDELVEKKIELSDYIKSVRYVPLEQTPATLIHSVAHLEIFENHIFILDVIQNNSILVFDMEGKYIRKIAKKGKGPGEFTRIGSFSIHPKSGNVYILDIGVQKIIIYTSKGKFIKEIKLPAEKTKSSYISVGENGYIYTNLNLGRKAKRIPHMIRALNAKGETLQFWLNPDIHNKGWYEPYNIIGTNGGFYKVEDRIAITAQYMDTIFMLKNNELLPYLSIKSEDFMTHEEIKGLLNIKRLSETFAALSKFPSIKNIQKYIENELFISFAYVKANRFYRVMFDKKSKTFFSVKLIDNLTLKNEAFPAFLNTIYADKDKIIGVGTKEGIEMNLSNAKISPSSIERLNEQHAFTDNPILVFYELSNE